MIRLKVPYDDSLEIIKRKDDLFKFVSLGLVFNQFLILIILKLSPTFFIFLLDDFFFSWGYNCSCEKTNERIWNIKYEKVPYYRFGQLFLWRMSFAWKMAFAGWIPIFRRLSTPASNLIFSRFFKIRWKINMIEWAFKMNLRDW